MILPFLGLSTSVGRVDWVKVLDWGNADLILKFILHQRFLNSLRDDHGSSFPEYILIDLTLLEPPRMEFYLSNQIKKKNRPTCWL